MKITREAERPAAVYAHSRPWPPDERWHYLGEHLQSTASLAEDFASDFAPGWGRIAGLWHDAGKYQPAFQQYILKSADAHCEGTVRGPMHAIVGAALAQERGSPLLALAIAAHHSRLKTRSEIESRVREQHSLLEETRRGGLPAEIESAEIPAYPNWLDQPDLKCAALWTRFLYSALIDADCLDTERWDRGEARAGIEALLRDLRDKLDSHLTLLGSMADDSPVNRMRAEVLHSCRAAAESGRRGEFTLTVPTGGGKTFASLAFALHHACHHNLERVIVVIPYTSILEQTVAEYRRVLGVEAVVEHHSNLDPENEDHRNRLSTENWDAPIVVTTSVQFFESLYANRKAACRKLHRIAQSVVILDEVQTFPPELLCPIRHVLAELANHYGTTIVHCTATQPILARPGLEAIIENPEAIFEAVADRFEVHLPVSLDDRVEWPELAEKIRNHQQVLAIVQRRDDAEELATLVGDDCLHLSARMCGAHRRAVLARVRRLLKDGSPCRLVATQLVEAGVDVDFPFVYRAFAGLDSLAQAAGRCNREMKTPGGGHFYVFVPPSKPPRTLRKAVETAKLLFQAKKLDLKHPRKFELYFAEYHQVCNLDNRNVLAAEADLDFPESAQRFRMIEDSGEPVLAPYGEGEERLMRLRTGGATREAFRSLQPFVVQLYTQEIKKLNDVKVLEPMYEGSDRSWAVLPFVKGVYSTRFGFGWKGVAGIEPEDLIA